MVGDCAVELPRERAPGDDWEDGDKGDEDDIDVAGDDGEAGEAGSIVDAEVGLLIDEAAGWAHNEEFNAVGLGASRLPLIGLAAAGPLSTEVPLALEQDELDAEEIASAEHEAPALASAEAPAEPEDEAKAPTEVDADAEDDAQRFAATNGVNVLCVVRLLASVARLAAGRAGGLGRTNPKSKPASSPPVVAVGDAVSKPESGSLDSGSEGRGAADSPPQLSPPSLPGLRPVAPLQLGGGGSMPKARPAKSCAMYSCMGVEMPLQYFVWQIRSCGIAVTMSMTEFSETPWQSEMSRRWRQGQFLRIATRP